MANDAVAGTKVILVAALAVVANEELTELDAQLEVPVNTPTNEPVNDPVLICTELLTNPLGSVTGANDALVANDAETVFVAQLEVPSKLPVNPPVDRVDPVTVNPFGKVIYPDAADAYDEVTE